MTTQVPIKPLTSKSHQSAAALLATLTAVHAVTFSPDGRTIAGGTFARTAPRGPWIRTWRVTTSVPPPVRDHTSRVGQYVCGPYRRPAGSGLVRPCTDFTTTLYGSARSPWPVAD
jgi:hypothetical protein